MMYKNSAFLIFFGLVCFSNVAMSQGFKGLIPLVSTCDDVRHVLKVEQCGLTENTYMLKDYWVKIELVPSQYGRNDLCYKVPPGRILSITVMYNKPFPIGQFQHSLTRKVGPMGDVGTVGYQDEKNGISVLSNNGMIGTVMYLPTPAQHRKYAFDCSSIK